MVWLHYGKNETPYTIEDLHQSLNTYAGKAFGDVFFNSYIHNSEMPDYKLLFESVGVILEQSTNEPYFGASVGITEEGTAIIHRNTAMHGAAYKAGLEKGDVLTTINGKVFEKGQKFNDIIQQYKVGEEIQIAYKRFEEEKSTIVKLDASPMYKILMDVAASKEALTKRKAWLKSE